MKTTAESSAPLTQMLKRTVPSTWLPVVNAYLDELESLRAAQAADTASRPGDAAQGVWQPDPAHARAVRSAKNAAAIEAALVAYTNESLNTAVSRAQLARLLHKRITAGIVLCNAGGEVPDAFKCLKKPPSWRAIYDHLADKLQV